MTIIVTGASGYIGGEIALKLKDAGYKVVGVDRRPMPKHLAEVFNEFVETDFSSNEALVNILKLSPSAVIHCAGTSLVGPSIDNPAEYYNNNVVKTLILIDTLRKSLPRTRFIFSSSAATYGIPIMPPCNEVDPCQPISPYGDSKLFVERMLESYRQAYGFDYVAFRYFNACGADSMGRHGQETDATHIIARVLESVKNNTQFVCNGNDYGTPDGTCIRDYIHVEDIADSHILAINTKIPAGTYNLGSGSGISNLDVIKVARQVTGAEIPVAFGPRRTGDPDFLTADSTKFQQAADWAPLYSIYDIVQHAWNWYNVR